MDFQKVLQNVISDIKLGQKAVIAGYKIYKNLKKQNVIKAEKKPITKSANAESPVLPVEEKIIAATPANPIPSINTVLAKKKTPTIKLLTPTPQSVKLTSSAKTYVPKTGQISLEERMQWDNEIYPKLKSAIKAQTTSYGSIAASTKIPSNTVYSWFLKKEKGISAYPSKDFFKVLKRYADKH